MLKLTRQTPSDQTCWGHHCCSPLRGTGPPQESAPIPFAMLPAQSSFKNRYELLLPETWNASTFSYSSLYTELHACDIIYITNIRGLGKLKGSRQTGQGLQDPRDGNLVGFLGFLLASYIPHLILTKSTHRKSQQAQTGSPDQGLSLL